MQTMAEMQVERVLQLTPSENNPRNSEGSFITLADGTIMYVYSHFVGGARDDSTSMLACRTSTDKGRTWSEDRLFLANEGDLNTMSVNLLRLHSGDIGLFYIVRNVLAGSEEHRPQQKTESRMRRSTDEAQTWSDPVVCTSPPSYYVVNNDRVIQLASGRLVVPAADHGHFDGASLGRGRGRCFLSDDEGASWRPSETLLEISKEVQSGLQEPGVIELADGTLMMLLRTSGGCQYRSWSEDGGETWSPVEPTELLSPISPASFKRIPSTGDIVLVYNDHRTIDETRAGKRTPLCTAISRDEGRTWENYRVLEDHPNGWYCYTAIHFVEDYVLLAYCAGDMSINHGGLNTTQITRVPVAWLYA